MTPEITFVEPEWVEAHADTVEVVDVREPRYYESLGHVPGAVNVPFAELRDRGGTATGMLPDTDVVEHRLGEAGITPEDDILAYDGNRGVEAARFLVTVGVYGHAGDLYLLDGDAEVWQRGHDTTTVPPEVTPTEYDAELHEAPIANRSDVERAIEDPERVLVDTRTRAEYEQAHVPGAVQVSWEEFVDEETRTLRSEPELRERLDEREIDPGRDVILYCNTARRLSHTYAVLSELGYDRVRIYEGSLTDWVRAKSPEWNPRELYEEVRSVADGGFDALAAELGEDVFSRLHLVGLYTTRQDGYFMLRTKAPGGQLTAEQARTLGEIAAEFATAPEEHGGDTQNPVFGDGFLDVTTRQGIQMHWIEPEDVPEIWDRYEEVGLTTVQASGNTLRNVVVCPAAGLGDDHLEVTALAAEIADAFTEDPRYANLPRKFKVSLSGCEENCGRAEIQDFGFVPATKDGQEGFALKVGGGLSDGPRAATDLGIFVPPERVVDLALAGADLFIDHGSYLDTAVNRLRYLVNEWGTDRFREELESYVAFEFEPYDELLTETYRGDHVGIHEQSDGRHYVGLNVPTGRLRGEDLVELATLAEQYGAGELRTTANQNLVLPGVTDEDLDALDEEPILERYSPDPGPFSRGIVTCTGREFCKYGVIETKTRGYTWARELDEWVDSAPAIDDESLPDAVRVHLSGCSASCAQPQIADVGLRGEAYRDESRTAQAVDVGLGGDLSQGEFLDWVVGRLPAADVPDAIRRVLGGFLEERAPGESFPEWTRRTGIERLEQLVEPEHEHRTQEAD